MAVGVPVKTEPYRARRTRVYWEPIFDQEAKAPTRTKWDFEHNRGPAGCVFFAVDLIQAVNGGLKSIFEGINFSACDFTGIFDLSPREIVFKNCKFFSCDFGLSTWRKAKFTGCEFKKCSFSQSNWADCEFRGCSWVDTGMSGNAMDMTTTVITNPGSFVRSAYTNQDPVILAKFGTSPFYQAMRLEGTKATVARSIVRMLVNVGDEGAYYEALRASSNQSTLAKISEAAYQFCQKGFKNKPLATFRLSLHSLEYLILNVAGFVNGWGRSIARPFMIGVALIMLFSLIYLVTNVAPDISSAFVKAAEITLLTGYTNHTSGELEGWKRYLMLWNMTAGLLWYVVFIPTLVNRISRVR